MEAQFFPFRFDKRYAPMWLPFGAKPGRDGVTITKNGDFAVRFGLLSLQTPMSNVVGGHVTEGYRWYTAIGARMSFADDGLTFGTNCERGVCVHFRRRVSGVVPIRAHSAVTVTLDDCDGFVRAIGSDQPA